MNLMYKAKCKLCNHDYTADISVLKAHAKTDRHLERLNPAKNTKWKMTQFVHQQTSQYEKLETAIKKAEIKIAGFFAEHDIAARGLDHLSEVLKDCFPDLKIAQKMTIKRTKGTAIIKNVIGESEKSQLAKKLMTQNSAY